MAGLLFAVIGFGAVLLGRDPNGLANHLFRIGRWLRARLAPALGGRLEGRLQGLLPRGGSPGGTDGAVDVPLVDMAVDVAVDVEKVG
jgi:branched-chain amino acid transport system permease protein